MLKRLLLVAALFASSVGWAAENDLTRSIGVLNQQSLSLLKIDLRSLRWLMEASPESYRPYDYLERSGELRFIEALKREGYVTVDIIDRLPDGSATEKHLRMIPTRMGCVVIKAVFALPPRQTNRSDGKVWYDSPMDACR